jgi:drug/metabolite transporter (DMT)-like permease
MGSDQVDPGRAGVLMMTEVLIGFISAYLLANELISFREAIGAVFILSAPLVELHYSGKAN